MSIDERDLRYEGYRNGAGQQFKIIHLPTGLSVSSRWISKEESYSKEKELVLIGLQKKINNPTTPSAGE